MKGTVSEYEERNACEARGYTWIEWVELPRWERITAVAYTRLMAMVDQQSSAAQRRHAEAQMNRQRRRAKR